MRRDRRDEKTREERKKEMATRPFQQDQQMEVRNREPGSKK